MSDVRIRCSARCIRNGCNERLLTRDDPKDMRRLLRDIIAHASLILEADSDPIYDKPPERRDELLPADEDEALNEIAEGK